MEEEVMDLRGSRGVGRIEGRKREGGNDVNTLLLYAFFK